MEAALKKQIKRRNELIEAIVIESLKGGEPSRYAQKLSDEISTAVANAIAPINPISSIHVIAVLKGYLNSLSEEHPDAAKAADRLLEKCESVVFNMPIKGDK